MRVGRARRRIAGVLVLAFAGALFVSCGGSARDGAASPGTTAASTTTAKRSAGSPRWETVTTFKGSGPTSAPAFDIISDAIQWRVRWRCETGSFRIFTDPPPRKKGPVVDSGCPEKGEGFSIATGKVRVTVEATAAWELTIDQQVDTPLEEPPLPGMDQARMVAQGAFYNVEMTGKGTAKLFVMPDGSRVVRFEGFATTNNTDLFVWLSEAASPRTSVEATRAGYRSLGNVKSTVGSMNYPLPADLPTEKVNSVIIWCEPVAIAYAAAPLSRS